MPPQLIAPVQPIYTNAMRAAGLHGKVVVRFTVEADGIVDAIAVTSSPAPALSAAAADAIKQWIFTAGVRKGKAVATLLEVPVMFALGSPASSTAQTDSFDRLFHSGLQATQARDYRAAVADFTRAIQVSPGLPGGYVGRASVDMLMGQDLRAIADLQEAIRLGPADPHLYRELGECHQRQHLLAQSLQDYTQAIRLGPNDYFSFVDRGLAFQEANELLKAVADFNRAIQLNPQLAKLYLTRSQIYCLAGRIPEAWSDISEAVRLEPAGVENRVFQSELSVRRGDYAEATADLETALRVDPNDRRAQEELASLLAACPEPKLRNGARAVTLATQACQSSQGSEARAWDVLAAADAETGNFDQARAAERRCLALLASAHSSTDGYQQRLALYQKNTPMRMEGVNAAAAAWADRRFQTFQIVWSTVSEAYYDPTFGGVDWPAVREEFRERLNTVADNGQLRRLLQEMLAKLHRTHFSILPRESAVFHPAERVRIGTAGAECAWIENQVVLSEIEPDSPAARSGLRLGDAVVSVDGIALAPIAAAMTQAGVPAGRRGLLMTNFVASRLSSAAGTRVKLRVTDAGDAPRDLAVTCGPRKGLWSEPVGSFPSQPVHYESRYDADGVAYLRWGIFTAQVMKGIRDFLESLLPEEGLIIDLRGNPGGLTVMAPGIAGWLSRNEFSMGTMHLRQGQLEFQVYPQAREFGGPVAILIDGGSASTSEIFSAGLQESHRARIFGEPSAGAALPSAFKPLPTGDLFQYAIADITTAQGRLLEGQGVIPDEIVLRSRAQLTDGQDQVIAAARAWLGRTRHPNLLAPVPSAP